MGTVVIVAAEANTTNTAGKFTGWTDVPLTPQGVREARHAGDLVRDAGALPDLMHTHTPGERSRRVPQPRGCRCLASLSDLVTPTPLEISRTQNRPSASQKRYWACVLLSQPDVRPKGFEPLTF
ncbi:histidine phosphatase family protein [Amycolatopsis saalfeldensis]|uniref:histidine phosphatase family protein n=1 Tax=Amycolatopsis saalfeldensis TaxID=394193 RepID=UPI0011601F4B|nr:hypothetical protein [Amycolatopsis saalfeldensis]